MARFAGHKLAEARTTRGLTREQLAVISGITVGTLTRYEQGRMTPGVNTAFALAEALGAQISDFMDANAPAGPELGALADLPEWAQDYIRQLRAEAAAHRTRARTAVAASGAAA